ncbi:MAG: endonuclease domain-containing protein [Acidimicrobiia bacterium]
MSEHLHRATALMARQHGLITTVQATNLGIDRRRAAALVRRGVWERAEQGLYGPAGAPWSWRRRAMAAALVAPAGSLISHRCAAALLGSGGISDPTPEITIPRFTNLRRSGVIVHESTDLHLAERRLVDGIPVTGPRRLAVDLGSVVSEARYRHAVREIRFQHGVSSTDLLRTYLRHKRSGRRGCGALRDWLDRYYAVEGVPESGIELVVLDALIDAGLPTPLAQVWVQAPSGRYRLDLAWPDLRVAIEVDGRQHADPEAVAADAIRDEALRALGWTVIRVRTWCLATDLREAIDSVRSFVGLSAAG